MTWEMVVGEECKGPPRAPLVGTDQQEAFWAELEHGSDNLVLEARAGTGKSTSCREGMWRLIDRNPNLVIRYCCFNKKVSEEFGEKSPPMVDVGTMHRFGLQALRLAFNSAIEKNKTYIMLDDCGGANLKRYIRKSISMLVGLAKNHLVIPSEESRLEDFGTLVSLIDRFDIQTYGQEDRIIDLAWKCLAKSIGTTSIVDFDDMLWLCVVHDVAFPAIDFLFIDEAQDLNSTQHAMAALMARSGRTIVVGDPYQSIYAFRGADSESMARLQEQLDATVMPLTVTFRCPRSHVEKARSLVADFHAAPNAPEGEWQEHEDESMLGVAKPGDLVLCRANAPLITACLKQIQAHRPATVRGRAIGESLVSVVSRLGDAPTIPGMLKRLDAWKSAEINRLKDRDGTDDLIEQTLDRAACIEAIARECGSPPEVPGVIDRLFSDDDSTRMVTFSSVHRAKGSEARNVLLLDVPYSVKRDKMRPPRPWELHQRRNLRYVAYTRSLSSMNLIRRGSGTTSPHLFEGDNE